MGNPTTHPELSDHRPDTIPSATVVLVRDGTEGLETGLETGLQTLVLRRDSRLNFAAGAWVFPGGRIDDDDFEQGRPSTDPDALLAAARRAAVREAAEEAGLAVDPGSLVWFSHWTPDLRTAPRFLQLLTTVLLIFVAVRFGLAVAIIVFDLSPASLLIPVFLGLVAWWLRPWRHLNP